MNVVSEDLLEHSEKIVYSSTSFNNNFLEEVQKNGLKRLTQTFFREGILTSVQEDNKLIFLLPRTSRCLLIDPVRLDSLGRYISFGNVYLEEKNGNFRQITDTLQLFNIYMLEVECEFDQQQCEKLSQEINNHIENALLSTDKHNKLDEIIIKQTKEWGFHGLLQWVTAQDKIQKSIFFEQCIYLGHPYHPCSKTKLGFSRADVLNYSPEFHPVVPIQVAAIQKDHIHIESMQNLPCFTDWFASNYPTAWQHWMQELQARQLCIEEFIPLPIHPWQASKIIPELFKEFIRNGTMYLFTNVIINATPTLSFRTLAPVDNQDAAYIKLPIAVQATSQFRTLASESTENVPKISDILSNIFTKENNFSGRLGILREFYGLRFKNIPEDQAKHLNVILRENANPYLSHDETAIVLAALFEISPVTKLPLFIELMHLNGITQLKDVQDYFHYYVDLVLGSYLDLYLLYGIALEGHQQNTLVVFRNNKVIRFIARDLEWAIFSRPYAGFSRLSKNYFSRAWLLYMVYQLHLGELVLLLTKHFNCSEKHFWMIIKKITEERFFSLKEKIEPQVWQTEYQSILEADWPCKALFRMRLQKNNNEKEIFFNVKNPLFNSK
jgi:siderophore synthetase component